jgi:peptide chain release factor subunit 1
MDSDRFRRLLDSPGPFASVYFDDSHDTDDAEAQLDLKWRALREQLEQQRADVSVTEEIGCAAMDLRAPIGRSGRAVVASATGVVLNKHLVRPTAETLVRVSELPYIVPIVELGFEDPDYLLVAVDHTGADITTHLNGTLRAPKLRDMATPSCAATKPPARTCGPSPIGSASSLTTTGSTRSPRSKHRQWTVPPPASVG